MIPFLLRIHTSQFATANMIPLLIRMHTSQVSTLLVHMLLCACGVARACEDRAEDDGASAGCCATIGWRPMERLGLVICSLLVCFGCTDGHMIA